MVQPRIRLVLNPQAGGGAAARRRQELERALNQLDLPCEILCTQGPGHASRLARQSLDDGVDQLAVVGGDGTLNEVAQAFLSEDGTPRPGPELSLIPCGTGGDFKRTLGVPADLLQALSRLRSGTTRKVDLAVMHLVDFDGRPCTRAFLNVASFGIGGVTDRLVNQTPKWLGGKASFFIGSARALLAYRNAPVRVLLDGEPFMQGPVFNVVLANGKYFGGGMLIAPQADPTDGLLDIVCMGDLSRTEALGFANKIYTGEHVHAPKVTCARASHIEATALTSTDVLLDVDGETPGKLPIHVQLYPQCVRVRV